MKTIALANQKGGVGKTTTAASLAIGLSRQGKKVLLVDADAQGNLTQMLGWPQPDELSPTLANLMGKIITDQPVSANEGILHHESGVDLLPANIELSALEVTLVNAMSRETVMRQLLSTVQDRYDYALIDCMDDAIKLVDKVIMSVDSDANRWQQRQNAHNNFTATLPYQLEQMRQVGKEYMDDLTERDQRMMHGVVTLTHLADSLEQLDQDTKSLQTRTGNCEFAVLNYQQEDALNTVLPYGLRRIDAVRTLTSESTAVLMPFKSQEIQDAGGIYYGVNPISHNLIICNRGSLMNGNGFIFGVSGSGKSMAAKQEITTLALATDHDIIIIDPEREYGPLVRALGGEIITISASSDTYINAMDISSEYGGGQNPLALKSDFIMSLCEQIMGAEQISARDKSIIDRCTANVYREYIKTYKGDPPTLKDLHDDLMRQKEPAAHDIALALELFTTGTLDVFAHQTNVNSRNRILCFDIQDLGENLKPIGLLVMLDAIMNRVIANRAEGKYTHVYIDEIYLFFAGSSMGGAGDNVSKYSAEFLYKCWKRFRKYYATLTGITQNVEECLRSDTARMMFANSEFLLMFNQAPNDREVLAHILNASSAQMSYVSDKPPGHGLIKVGGAIVPLVNEFPKDTSLYWLMTTKPGEG